MLDLHPEKLYLRIRSDEKSDSDSENDRSKSNHTDIRIKVRDISRVDLGRDKSSEMSESSPAKLATHFSLVMRRFTSDIRTYTFQAGSPVTRDLIVSCIKGLQEHSRNPSVSRRRKSQSPIVEDGRSSHQRTLSTLRNLTLDSTNGSQRAIQPTKTPGEEGLEATIEYFDFDLKNEDANDANEVDTQSGEDRNDYNERTPDTSEERTSADQDERENANEGKKLDSTNRKSRSVDSDLAVEEKDATATRQAKEMSITVIETKGLEEVAVEVARKEWSVDDILCGLRSGGYERRQRVIENGSVDKHRTKGKDRAIKLKEMKESIVDEGAVGCQALICQSEALAAMEEVELAGMGYQVAGPWCTDDVCSASLKDFAETMKGIFEMKEKSREGKPDSEKQRALAEDYITGVLGAPATMVNLLSVKDIWNAAAAKRPVNKQEGNRIQNRAGNVDAQADRLQRLRNQMTFSGAESNEKMKFVQVISSFDDTSKPAEIGIQSNSSAFPFMGKEVKPEDDESDILFYDSDPEYSRVRSLRRGPRRVLAEQENKLEAGAAPARRTTLGGIPMKHLGLNRRWKKMDEDVMTEIIDVS
jgi:hypothetical protein